MTDEQTTEELQRTLDELRRQETIECWQEIQEVLNRHGYMLTGVPRFVPLTNGTYGITAVMELRKVARE